METGKPPLSLGVEIKNSQTLLNCDYNKLGRYVSRAVIEQPSIITFLEQRDLTLLTKEQPEKPGLHMRACMRMTCALLGLKDPFPKRKSVHQTNGREVV